jgi:hypothetical protein
LSFLFANDKGRYHSQTVIEDLVGCPETRFVKVSGCGFRKFIGTPKFLLSPLPWRMKRRMQLSTPRTDNKGLKWKIGITGGIVGRAEQQFSNYGP